MGLGLALGAFLKCLFNKDFSREVKELALQRKRGEKSKTPVAEKSKKVVQKAEAKEKKEPKTEKDLYSYGAAHLLADMQKEGRLIDFLNENLREYSDEEIGSSVRSIHEGCKKVLDSTLTMEKIVDQEEESTYRVNKGYDAKSVRLTGRVGDVYPMKGTLIHPGWKVKNIKLTEKDDQVKKILAPAEVEVE